MRCGARASAVSTDCVAVISCLSPVRSGPRRRRRRRYGDDRCVRRSARRPQPHRRASGVRIDLSGAALTGDRDAVADAAATLGADPWDWVLGGGEDHSLVATFPGRLPVGWRAIRRILDGAPEVLFDGAVWQGDPGWQSFD